jgi:uncharacterized protein (UPF0248 family)
MIPIHELLNRIRWDPEFGRGRLEIGFFDRHEGVIHRVALRDVAFPNSGEHVFQFVDEGGQHRRVPFHRIREVWRMRSRYGSRQCSQRTSRSGWAAR